MVVNELFSKNKNIELTMKRFNISVLCLSLLATIAFTSCNDVVNYDEGYDDGMTSHGAPVISAVYDVDDTELTNPLTEADFGDYIMLKGENLSNVTRILMNDVEVDMDNVYATASSAWFAVPSTAPNEITNKIYYTTELGETQYDFTVIVPDVNVTGLYNEMAPAGTSVKVLGSYFSLHGFGTKETSKVTMNGTPLEVSDVKDDEMVITIPADAQPNSTIVFEWVGTNGQKTISIPYARKNDLIYEDWSTAGNWGDPDCFIQDDPNALWGPYFRINKQLTAWSWNVLLGCGISLSEEILNTPSNYWFKFEVRSATETPFQDTSDSEVNGYCIKIGEWDNDFQFYNNWEWNPSAGQIFNTYGEWCTIRLDLAELLAAKIPQAGTTNFSITFQPIADVTVDHSFANFRIEKKNN